jgi:ornithine cyclodeaminase/alanine dehydrogenase-like protein (mu-crystallin family)
VWSPDPHAKDAFAKDMSKQPGIVVSVVHTAEDAVRPAEIVVKAMPATTPIVRAEWLSAGQLRDIDELLYDRCRHLRPLQ